MRQTLDHSGATAVGRHAVGWISGAALLLSLVGCHGTTARLRSTAVVDEMAHLAQPASEPPATPVADIAELPLQNEPELVVDPARPWKKLIAIWFHYRSAELTTTETERIATIVRYTTQHPGAEVGINRPADLSGVEPDNDVVNRQRIAAIRGALIQGGIPSVQIHVGAFEDWPASINRLVVVCVRDGP